MNEKTTLDLARQRLYGIAGGGIDSNNVRAAHISTQQRMEYFRSEEFRAWVASEREAGRRVFWLKDVDKTQAAGDIFTFFWKWRLDNGALSARQLARVRSFLLQRRSPVTRYLMGAAGSVFSMSALHPQQVIDLWLQKEAGGKGIGLLEFWSKVYWPSQFGLTREEKLQQVQAFAPEYAHRLFPGVAEENRLLTELGVDVVIVSNGDQELAIAVAPVLGIDPLNVVGSHLVYGDNGVSTGVNHSYEIFDKEWETRPQPGKSWSFHYWLNANSKRFGWPFLDIRRATIGGCDGDSATTDGGMMLNLPVHAAIGNFMVNTPGEPGRIEKFYRIAAKYGWLRGQFFTLHHEESRLGFKP